MKGTEKMDTQSSPAKNSISMSEKNVTVRYKNYRGEVAVRTIIPIEGGLFWGKTEYHPHEQWLLKVWDVEKNAERIYALCDIQEFLQLTK
jgi:hypothetical protein